MSKKVKSVGAIAGIFGVTFTAARVGLLGTNPIGLNDMCGYGYDKIKLENLWIADRLSYKMTKDGDLIGDTVTEYSVRPTIATHNILYSDEPKIYTRK